MVGSIALAMRSSVSGLGRWVMYSAMVLGATVIVFAISKSIVLAVIVLVPCGCAGIVQSSSTNTLIQAMVPDELRGRVISVYSMMLLGMAPFGALLAGTLADRIGAPETVALGGAVTIIGGIVFGLRLPALRGHAQQLIIAQQASAGEPASQTTATGAEAI